MNWQDVRDELKAELERIWFSEPEEVTMSKLGIFPGGAGTMSQAFVNQYFQVADLEALAYGVVEPTMYAMLTDDLFTLEHCKKVFCYMTEGNVELMGGVQAPDCTAPWFNLPNVTRIFHHLVESYDTISTKKEFLDLIWLWECYMNRLHFWFWNVFPWELGLSRPRIDKQYMQILEQYLYRLNT